MCLEMTSEAQLIAARRASNRIEMDEVAATTPAAVRAPLATRRAWRLPLPGGGRVRRVWLQTPSRDHPNAIHNDEKRGFRTFHIEDRLAW
jgi:hypothetical protein